MSLWSSRGDIERAHEELRQRPELSPFDRARVRLHLTFARQAAWLGGFAAWFFTALLLSWLTELVPYRGALYLGLLVVAWGIAPVGAFFCARTACRFVERAILRRHLKALDVHALAAVGGASTSAASPGGRQR